MSTSLLYHICGIRGYEYRRTEYIDGAVLFHIEQPRERLRCPRCGTAKVIARGAVPRLFRSVPMGSRLVWIDLKVPRVHCPGCNITRQVRIGFADEHCRYTRGFARYALELTRFGTIQDVADHLGVGWDLIKDLKKTDLARRFRQPKLRHLKHLAIDEICVGRGRRFRTVVLDLDTGAVSVRSFLFPAGDTSPFGKRQARVRRLVPVVPSADHAGSPQPEQSRISSQLTYTRPTDGTARETDAHQPQ